MADDEYLTLCREFAEASLEEHTAMEQYERARYAYATGQFDPSAQVAMQRAMHRAMHRAMGKAEVTKVTSARLRDYATKRQYRGRDDLTD